MKEHPSFGIMKIAINVFNMFGIESASAPYEAVYNISLLQQKFCKVRTVLTGDAYYYGVF